MSNPEEFKARKKASRKNKRVLEWVSMRKGVAYLFRYHEISQQANHRYLEALEICDPLQTKAVIRTTIAIVEIAVVRIKRCVFGLTQYIFTRPCFCN